MHRRRRFFIDRASAYAREREVFGRAIGENQGVQFPIARAHASADRGRADGRSRRRLFDAGEPCGSEANMAKMRRPKPAWYAADMCVQTHGGFGFAEEYDIERKFRETRLYQVAPISTNLILSHVATHVLGLPKSF
jgi:acyl-CoA dehydrogenase